MGWAPAEDGATIGSLGSEGGVISIDEEHELGARITLEQGGAIAPFAITCGIYGWMMHTRFFDAREPAERDLALMKVVLDEILESVPYRDDPEVKAKMAAVTDAIDQFTARFP